MAPWGIDNHDSLSLFLKGLGSINGIQIGNVITFPKISVESLLGSVDVNTALSLGASIFVSETDKSTLSLKSVSEPLSLVTLELEVLEGHALVLRDWDGVLGISNRWVSLSMEWVVGNLVVSDVIKSIFKGPVGNWVNVSSTTCLLRSFEDINPCSLISLPSSSSSDHSLTLEVSEPSQEWLNLADLVVLFDILLPKVGSVLFIKLFLSLISISLDTLSHGNMSFEFVMLFDLLDKVKSFVKKMQCVHEQHWDLIKKSQSRDQVGDDDVTSNQSIWENNLSTRINSLFDGIHCLFLKMSKSHLFACCLELLHSFLIPSA